MKVLLLVLILKIKESFTINGFLWDKNTKKFVPIFSVSEFMVLRKKIVNQNQNYDFRRTKNLNESHSGRVEYFNMREVTVEDEPQKIHNFNGQEFHFIYYDVKKKLIFYKIY